MNMTNIYKDFLAGAGLSLEQAQIYEILLKNGVLPARKISQLSNMKRGLCYKVIDQLLVIGLIEKIDKKVALFSPAHPQKLTETIEKRKETLNLAEKSLNTVLGSMVSDYNMYSGRPNTRFLEGIAGIESLYEDILLEGKPIKLIRSPFDNKGPELATLVERQIKKQIAAGIDARAITPHEKDSELTMKTEDTTRNVNRVLLPKEKLSIPAQIIIYGDKVALTSYGEFLVTTIIQNPDIKTTFDALFEILWSEGQRYTAQILKR